MSILSMLFSREEQGMIRQATIQEWEKRHRINMRDM